MAKLVDMRKELRDLRKKHCPQVSKMKKADVIKEIERLKDQPPTEYQHVPKERKQKIKKETKEIGVQADVETEEKETKMKAAKKIKNILQKNVQQKKEKQKKEAEMMGAEDRDVGKIKKKTKKDGYYMTSESTSIRGTGVTSSSHRKLYKVTRKDDGKYELELVYEDIQGQLGKSYRGPPKRKSVIKDVVYNPTYRSFMLSNGKQINLFKKLTEDKMGLGAVDENYMFYQRGIEYVKEQAK